jgi:hypothetical protein
VGIGGEFLSGSVLGLAVAIIILMVWRKRGSVATVTAGELGH